MPNTIYSIQEKLDSILDIKSIHTIPDKELFDCSDYPNGGKNSNAWGHFDRTGILHTEEARQLMSISRLKQDCPRTGKKHTAESKRKIGEAGKGRIVTEETRRKISETGKGKHKAPKSEEHKRKLSESVRRYHARRCNTSSNR
tara:strand:+ start:141 stop:569 length:429 start_codon:yes stop_codon:yes gene_type:complete